MKMKQEELAVLALAALAVYLIVKAKGATAWKQNYKVTQLPSDGSGRQYFSDGVMIDENGVYYDPQGYAVWAPGMF